MNSTDRLPVLDGLRAISILLVLAAHMLPLGPKVLQINAAAGGMGMSLFFALSGFLITSTLMHNANIVEFLVKRMARIVPLAYAYALFVFVILSFDPAALFWTASFVVNYFPQYMVDGYNNHFWSLCVEVHFYLAIALVVLFAGIRGIWIVWPACLAVTAMRVGEGAYYHIATHLRVDEILAGACVATLYSARWKDGLKLPAATLALAVLLWFASASPYSEWFQYFRPYATAAVLAAVLAQQDTRLAAFLASRPMRYIAAVSYALYVVHPLTIHGWFNQGSVFDRYLFKRPISFVMTFAAAHISTFYWERRWIQAAKNWSQQRKMRRLESSAARSNS